MEAARQALSNDGNDATESTCGPYRVLSTAAASYLETCRSIAADFDSVYFDRLGVTTPHPPTGLIMLFGSTEAFRAFAASSAQLRQGYAGFSQASRGVVALAAEDLPLERFATVLAHELAHLSHRRAFGRRLPPWLSEGLADAVGDTATPSGFTTLDRNVGAEPLAERLRQAIDHGRAEPVAAVMIKSRTEFDRGTVSFDYETSALLVRFLLTDPELGPRFRSFLRRLASIQGCDLLCMLETVESDGRELDQQFRQWLGSPGPVAAQ